MSTTENPSTPQPPIQLLRYTGYAEGVSYLLLLGVAMPLKYMAGWPTAVEYVGMAHGILFIALCLVIAFAWFKGLPLKLAALAFVASLLPAGPFIIDHKLKKWQESATS